MVFLTRFYLYFLMMAFLVTALAAGQENRLNIAVLDLDPTGITGSDAQFLSDRLRTELFETGKFQIVERDKMNEILKEQGFQQTGCSSVECAVEIGQLLNVQFMVAGNIGKIEDLYSLSIRMIDVSSGAIISTATKDHEGRLSEVLTEVIPEVAAELGTDKITETTNQELDKNKEKETGKNDWSKFAVLIEGGFSTLTYTTDINKEIEKLNATIAPDIEELGAHYSLGLEFRYALSADWQLKLGFIAENPLSSLQSSLNNYTPPSNALVTFDLIDMVRKNRFVNTYIGVNYCLWNKPGDYDIFLGIDVGSTSYDTDLYLNYEMQDGTQREETSTDNYSSLTWKFSLGGTYFISRVISLGVSLQFKSVQPFNTSDETITPEVPDELIPVFFPKEMNASGVLFSFYLGFHF